jgi:hypothetical protein
LIPIGLIPPRRHHMTKKTHALQRFSQTCERAESSTKNQKCIAGYNLK